MAIPPSTSLLWTLGFNSCFIAWVEFFFSHIFELRLSKFKYLEVKMTGGYSISHLEEDCYESMFTFVRQDDKTFKN